MIRSHVLLAHLRHAASRHDGLRTISEKCAFHRVGSFLTITNQFAACGHFDDYRVGRAHLRFMALTLHHAENPNVLTEILQMTL